MRAVARSAVIFSVSVLVGGTVLARTGQARMESASSAVLTAHVQQAVAPVPFNAAAAAAAIADVVIDAGIAGAAAPSAAGIAAALTAAGAPAPYAADMAAIVYALMATGTPLSTAIKTALVASGVPASVAAVIAATISDALSDGLVPPTTSELAAALIVAGFAPFAATSSMSAEATVVHGASIYAAAQSLALFWPWSNYVDSQLQPLQSVGFAPPTVDGVIYAYMDEYLVISAGLAVDSDYNVDANSAVTLTGTITPALLADRDMNSVVTLTPTFMPGGVFLVTASSVVTLTPSMGYADEAVAWVMNLNTNASSRYTNFPFDSIIYFDGRFIAAGAGGLYELAGDTDAAGELIVSSVLLGTSDFDSPFKKQLDSLYLGVQATGDIHVKIRTDDGRSRTYSADPTGTLRTRYVHTGKGVRGRYFGIELLNPDGGDFTLDSVELEPVILKRRR